MVHRKTNVIVAAGILIVAVIALPLCVAAQSLQAPTSAPKPYLAELQSLDEKADWIGLERVARRTLASLETGANSDSPDIVEVGALLAEALQGQGRYPEAEPLLRRALTSAEKLSGPDQTATADAEGNLAGLLMAEGRYAEAETLFRQALAIDERRLGAESPAIADSLNNLAAVLQDEGRYLEAEPLYRRAVAIDEKAPGAKSQDTAQYLASLASVLDAQGRYPEAEPFLRRALAIDEAVLGPDHPQTARALDRLASLLADQGRYPEAEPLFRRALAIREALGPDSPETGEGLNNLAMLLQQVGQPAEAEALYRLALPVYEATGGPAHPETATVLSNLAVSLESLGRHSESEPLFRRAIAIDEKALGPEAPLLAVYLGNLAELLQDEGRYPEAEALFRRSLAIRQKAFGAEHPVTVQGLNNLALLLQYEGKYAEAEGLYRQAVAGYEKALGPDHSETGKVLSNLADLLMAQGRYGQAEPLLRRVLAIDEKALPQEHPETLLARESLADLDIRTSRFAEAAALLRAACVARASASSVPGANAATASQSKVRANGCAEELSLALWGWSNAGGGAAAGDRPAALAVEAFASTQSALQSAAGDALARSAALTAAAAAGVGDTALAYEGTLARRDALDREFAIAAGDNGPGAAAKRETLDRARRGAITNIELLAQDLKIKAPLYWDYRSPEPVSVSALQARSGSDAALLRPYEALVLFMIPPGKDKGLVFAVSKAKLGWSRIGLSGDELETRIQTLRSQIDPKAYGVKPGSVRSRFDRQAAYELYMALLGDPRVQNVIKGSPTLLIVPSGPLTSLPPGLLVTAPPRGGKAGDGDPKTLRKTAWLLRKKSIAILPAVSSLRTLRQLLRVESASATDPLLAFADPDFGAHAAEGAAALPAGPRGFNAYFRNGRPLSEALKTLQPLPGTREEAHGLQLALGAGPESVLVGPDASKAQLMARNADGRLAKVRVLEFATHGLVAGDVAGLAQPALALAAGSRPEDELLLASEAATLTLHAEWVLLSACNTASPDAPEAQGLSGLSRAFFFAGARSLLISHWRVSDEIAPRLLPALLEAEQRSHGLSHAQALRKASLAILDDPTLEAADPAAWAPFVLVGEAER